MDIRKIEHEPITITPKKSEEEIFIKRILGGTETWQNLPKIPHSRDGKIVRKTDIAKFVELPLLKACEIFWDKNIKTTETHANTQAIQEGLCYIRLDFETLSEENKQIALPLGTIHEDLGNKILEIALTVNKSTSPQEVESHFIEIAEKFNKQPATWIHPETKADIIAYHRAKRGDNTSTLEQELNTPGAWEDYCKRNNYFLDPTGTYAYQSEELYKKVIEEI